MQTYSVHFIWPPGSAHEGQAPQTLQAESPAEAMIVVRALFEAQPVSTRAFGYDVFDGSGKLIGRRRTHG